MGVSAVTGANPLGISPSRCYVIVVGDLNYRVNLSCEEALAGIVASDREARSNSGANAAGPASVAAYEAPWQRLLLHDQLRHVLRLGAVLPGFAEPPIAFPPSYRRRKSATPLLVRARGDYSDAAKVKAGYSTKKVKEGKEGKGGGGGGEDGDDDGADDGGDAVPQPGVTMAANGRSAGRSGGGGLPGVPESGPLLQQADSRRASNASDVSDAGGTGGPAAPGNPNAPAAKAPGGNSSAPTNVRTPSFTDRCLVRQPLLAGVPVAVSEYQAQRLRRRSRRLSTRRVGAGANGGGDDGADAHHDDVGAPRGQDGPHPAGEADDGGRTFVPLPVLRCLGYDGCDALCVSDHMPIGALWEMPLGPAATPSAPTRAPAPVGAAGGPSSAWPVTPFPVPVPTPLDLVYDYQPEGERANAAATAEAAAPAGADARPVLVAGPAAGLPAGRRGRTAAASSASEQLRRSSSISSGGAGSGSGEQRQRGSGSRGMLFSDDESGGSGGSDGGSDAERGGDRKKQLSPPRIAPQPASRPPLVPAQSAPAMVGPAGLLVTAGGSLVQPWCRVGTVWPARTYSAPNSGATTPIDAGQGPTHAALAAAVTKAAALQSPPAIDAVALFATLLQACSPLGREDFEPLAAAALTEFLAAAAAGKAPAPRAAAQRQGHDHLASSASASSALPRLAPPPAAWLLAPPVPPAPTAAELPLYLLPGAGGGGGADGSAAGGPRRTSKALPGGRASVAAATAAAQQRASVAALSRASTAGPVLEAAAGAAGAAVATAAAHTLPFPVPAPLESAAAGAHVASLPASADPSVGVMLDVLTGIEDDESEAGGGDGEEPAMAADASAPRSTATSVDDEGGADDASVDAYSGATGAPGAHQQEELAARVQRYAAAAAAAARRESAPPSSSAGRPATAGASGADALRVRRSVQAWEERLHHKPQP
jgi:hypothetical protein